MISPYAIKRFLKRSLNDHSWMKELSLKEINAALGGLCPKPDFRVPLKKHQKVCFLLGVAFPQFFFMLDMGSGKTGVVLELMRYFYKAHMLHRAIVVAPSEHVINSWVREIKKWRIDLPYEALGNSSSAAKWDAVRAMDHGLVLVSYPGLAAMLSHVKLDRRKRKRKRKRDMSLVNEICEQVQALVLDQSTKVMNKTSLQFKVCDAISKRTRFHYAMAGRTFGRDPTPLWAQYYLVDRGETLGPTLGLFREAFFNKSRNFFGGPFSYDYSFNKRRVDDLSRMVANRSIHYTIHECFEMPQLVKQVREVSFPEETQAYYDKVVSELRKAHGNFKEVKNSFLRMRQLSSGFMGFKDDETGERAEIDFKDNPKLDCLLDMLNDMPDNAKALVFHEYTYSGRRICSELKKRKIEHGWLWGGTKNSKHLLERFDEDSDMTVMVVNHKLGSMGLNLQAASYVFVYESPVSCIDRDEMERRAWRGGQLNTVMLYDLVVRGSVDGRILDFHRQGHDLFKAMRRTPDVVLKRTA